MSKWRNSFVFAFGLAIALFVGWVVFPRVLYSHKHQPLDFLHKTHAEKSGVADCAECHTIREDGTFAGLPAMEKCAACHSERVGESKAEAILVDSYIKPGHETPWLVYARQPANVWFSHAIHVKRANLSLHRMSLHLRRVGSRPRLRSESHQRLQSRHLGNVDVALAARST